MKTRTVDACELQPYSAAADFLWAWPPADRGVSQNVSASQCVNVCRPGRLDASTACRQTPVPELEGIRFIPPSALAKN